MIYKSKEFHRHSQSGYNNISRHKINTPAHHWHERVIAKKKHSFTTTVTRDANSSSVICGTSQGQHQILWSYKERVRVSKWEYHYQDEECIQMLRL